MDSAMKAENIDTVFLDDKVLFDGMIIRKISFDLEHINRGWNKEVRDYNKTRRSHYTAEDVTDFFEQFGHYSIEWEEGYNKFLIRIHNNSHYRYIAYVIDFETEEQKKIIVDIPQVFSGESIIVTIY